MEKNPYVNDEPSVYVIKIYRCERRVYIHAPIPAHINQSPSHTSLSLDQVVYINHLCLYSQIHLRAQIS